MKDFIEKFKIDKSLFSAEKLFVRLLNAWIFACFAVFIKSGVVMTEKEFLKAESVSLTIVLTVVFFLLLNFAAFFLSKLDIPKFEYESVLLLLSTAACFSYCLILDNDIYLTVFLCALISLCCLYCFEKNKHHFPSKDLSKKSTKAFVMAFALIALAVMLVVGIFRCLTFSAPNYDLGIFTNTAYNLKTRFIQYNTCERDGLITHFQVHISPVLYLLTPFYFFFPSAITLQVVQAVVVVSSVIPVYLICKRRSLSNKMTAALCFISVFFPALSTGTFYDFHENAFLPALILWMIYFYEKKKYIPMFIFALLTLSVKEDASVYVAFFGLYLLTVKGDRTKGLLLSVLSIAYIFSCIYFINKFGFGAMTNRFKDFITDERLGLISMASTIILDPIFVIKNCISSEKLAFILQVMIPFLFLPFVTKKYSRFILLGPFVLMNLMPSYKYQHSIYFQYLFGVVPLLTYLSVINAGELSEKTKKKAVCCCLFVTLLCYCSFVLPKTYYVEKYFDSTEKYELISETLDKIPDDVSVSAPAFYVPYLANREDIYENEYTDKVTDYIVFDLRYAQEKNAEMALDLNKYELVEKHEDLVAVYKMRAKG